MTIDRLTINELSYDLFVSEYADKKPFILTGAMDHWECRPWTLEYIDEHYGDRMVTIRKSDIEGVKTFKQDYLHILSAILEQPSILIEHIGLSGSNEEEENALDSIQLNF